MPALGGLRRSYRTPNSMIRPPGLSGSLGPSWPSLAVRLVAGASLAAPPRSFAPAGALHGAAPPSLARPRGPADQAGNRSARSSVWPAYQPHWATAPDSVPSLQVE